MSGLVVALVKAQNIPWLHFLKWLMGAAVAMVSFCSFLSVCILISSQGSGCGKCFKLTLINPVVATPPFYPDVVKSVIIKIIDLCPLSNAGWCDAMNGKPNP